MNRLTTALIILIVSVLPSCSSTRIGGPHDPDLPYEPGGMWTPKQIAEFHADTLREMGLEIDPAVFADPLKFPLNAIVHLGGCSASFISPDGLIITNYHCVNSYLQYNSTEESNLLHTGFMAHSIEELKNRVPV